MSKGQDVRRQTSSVKRLQDPPVAQALFGEVRWAWIWLILRLYAGYEWLNAAAGKWQNPAWTGPKAGAAISGFAQGALQETAGAHPNVQGWYAWFLQHAVLTAPVFWSYLITVGETLVGIALVPGQDFPRRRRAIGAAPGTPSRSTLIRNESCSARG
jgi:hypothetical protein